MLGLLIYDKEGYNRNLWFINHLIELGEEKGVELKLVLDKEVDTVLKECSPSFIWVRTINPDLSKRLEDQGYKVINNATTSLICNDKYLTYLFFEKNGLNCLETSLLDRTPFYFPVVIKARAGHGGSEVYLCNNLDDYRNFFNNIYKYVHQPLCDEPGIDVRLYMIGNECVAAMKRTNPNDFRSNFSLGGKAEQVNPPLDVIKQAQQITSLLKSDFIGIDFIRHQGEWILNELEDSAGSRMLYANTNIDIAELLIDYLKDKEDKHEHS